MADQSTRAETHEQASTDSQKQFTPQTQLGLTTETAIAEVLSDPITRRNLAGEGASDLEVIEKISQEADSSLLFRPTNEPNPLLRPLVYDSKVVTHFETILVRTINTQIAECRVKAGNPEQVQPSGNATLAGLEASVVAIQANTTLDEERAARELTQQREGQLLEDLISQLDPAALEKIKVGVKDIRELVDSPNKFIDNPVLLRILTVSQIKSAAERMKAPKVAETPLETVGEPATEEVSEVATTVTEAEPDAVPPFEEAVAQVEEEQTDPMIEEIRALATRLGKIEKEVFGGKGFIGGAAEALTTFANYAGPLELQMMKDLLGNWQNEDDRKTKYLLNAYDGKALKGIMTTEEALQIAFATGFQRAREQIGVSSDQAIDGLRLAAIGKGQHVRPHNSNELSYASNKFMAHVCAAVLKGGLAVRKDITDAQVDRFVAETTKHQSIGLSTWWDGDVLIKQLATQQPAVTI